MPRQTAIPSLVRVKAGALDRLGRYLRREGFEHVLLLVSEGLHDAIQARALAALRSEGISLAGCVAVADATFESAVSIFREIDPATSAIIGLGGGKALDVAKYVAFLARLPYVSVPTSLSNDGFCSPQSSLTVEGRRRSLPAAMPFGVILDTDVCVDAPMTLWLSGVGDLVSKFTAVADWKLAFHARGTPVDDFAVVLADASINQFLVHPERDAEGVRLLGTSLLMTGIAMSICGSSRPASGSEHLISHALDAISARPRSHGLQVGVATYLVSRLQGGFHSERITSLLETTSFWQAIADDPFDRDEWIEAVRIAPTLKADFHTVLSERDCGPEVVELISNDSWLRAAFGVRVVRDSADA